jgi:cell division protease FtsH
LELSLRFSPAKRRAAVLIGAGLFLASAVLLVVMRASKPAPREVPFSEFLHALAAGDVNDVQVGGDTIGASLKDGQRVRTTAPQGYVAASPTFLNDLIARGVRVDVQGATTPSAYSLGALLLTLGFVALVGVTVYRLGNGRLPSMEGEARRAAAEQTTVTFDDVAGVDEAKDEVREIVEFLREPGRFAGLGGRIPKGVLLVGPPGTGKTLLARSIAGEAGVPFLFASGSDFVEMYAGVGAARVRKLFREARKQTSCIIFIDELDAVGRSRGSQSLSHEEREQTLNQLLVEMDGFAGNRGTVVIAATNRPDILDRALLRPGRFDRQVVVSNPDLRGREAILRVHAAKMPMDADVDLTAIARGTPGFSGADLANLVNEAALLAARTGQQTISTADLDAARDKVLMGVERKSLVMTEDERRTTAYHEAGHTVIAALLPLADPIHKVTIIPRGRALGVTMQLPEADRHTHSKDYLEGQLAILMGGRVAEEVFTGRITSGAGNDIERATEIARRMVCEFGMSSFGPIAFRRAGAPWEDDGGTGFSEATARRVDEEIRDLVMRGYETARRLIGRHRDAVEALAEELLQVESLDAEAVRAVLAGRADRIEVAARSTADSDVRRPEL